MTTRSIPQSLRWLGAPHQDDLDITPTQIGVDAASPHLPGLANRRVIRPAVGREMAAPFGCGGTAPKSQGPWSHAHLCGPTGRNGYRLRQHDVGLLQGKRKMAKSRSGFGASARPTSTRVHMTVGSFTSVRVCPLSGHCGDEFLWQGRDGPTRDSCTATKCKRG